MFASFPIECVRSARDKATKTWMATETDVLGVVVCSCALAMCAPTRLPLFTLSLTLAHNHKHAQILPHHSARQRDRHATHRGAQHACPRALGLEVRNPTGARSVWPGREDGFDLVQDDNGWRTRGVHGQTWPGLHHVRLCEPSFFAPSFTLFASYKLSESEPTYIDRDI